MVKTFIESERKIKNVVVLDVRSAAQFEAF